MDTTWDPPSPTRAKKRGSCPGESLSAALQNRVQPTVQQCLLTNEHFLSFFFVFYLNIWSFFLTGSQYRSNQRNLAIQRDNQILLKKLQKIGVRDASMSRNPRYFEKRRSLGGSRSENSSSLTSPATSALMKSVREKEKKSIEEEKSRIEVRFFKLKCL